MKFLIVLVATTIVSSGQVFAGPKSEIRALIKSYEKALNVDTDFAHGYRGLGLLSYQRGDYKVAREALEFYLSHGRDIRDQRYINNILNRMDKL